MDWASLIWDTLNPKEFLLNWESLCKLTLPIKQNKKSQKPYVTSEALPFPSTSGKGDSACAYLWFMELRFLVSEYRVRILRSQKNCVTIQHRPFPAVGMASRLLCSSRWPVSWNTTLHSFRLAHWLPVGSGKVPCVPREGMRGFWCTECTAVWFVLHTCFPSSACHFLSAV